MGLFLFDHFAIWQHNTTSHSQPALTMNNNVAFWHQWISLQLEHNLDRMVELSIKNFHFPGLNYVCFEFSPQQTIRLYILDPDEVAINTEAVNIHNHLYDSQLLVLKGQIVNRIYKLDNERDDYNIYALTSALHPENEERRIKLKQVAKRGLRVDSATTLRPGETHFQPHTQIHSVSNVINEFTAFMVFEFPTVKKNSNIFTKEDFGDTIPTPNAYLRYERDELRALVQKALDRMAA